MYKNRQGNVLKKIFIFCFGVIYSMIIVCGDPVVTTVSINLLNCIGQNTLHLKLVEDDFDTEKVIPIGRIFKKILNLAHVDYVLPQNRSLFLIYASRCFSDPEDQRYSFSKNFLDDNGRVFTVMFKKNENCQETDEEVTIFNVKYGENLSTEVKILNFGFFLINGKIVINEDVIYVKANSCLRENNLIPNGKSLSHIETVLNDETVFLKNRVPRYSFDEEQLKTLPFVAIFE